MDVTIENDCGVGERAVRAIRGVCCVSAHSECVNGVKRAGEQLANQEVSRELVTEKVLHLKPENALDS